MKLQFQKPILSRFISILVHFSTVDFSLDLNQGRDIVFWVQHISENKVGRGEEEVGGILWSFIETGAGADEAKSSSWLYWTPVLPTDPWALSSDL